MCFWGGGEMGEAGLGLVQEKRCYRLYTEVFYSA